MINSLLTSITRQLGNTFGKSYKYYIENVEQKRVDPCFTADVLIPIKRAYGPNLYHLTMPVVIHFFTDEKETPKAKAYEMGEQLLECLEYLDHDGKLIRGIDMSFHIIEDNVLQVFITYKYWTEPVSTIEEFDMENIAGVGINSTPGL